MTHPTRSLFPGLATHSSGRIPGSTGLIVIRGNPTQPAVHLDPSWTSAERQKIVAALQQISASHITQTGLQVFTDSSSLQTGSPDVGFILRAFSQQSRKVIIVPTQPGNFIPDATRSGSDVRVGLAFDSNGNLDTFHFFTNTALSLSTYALPPAPAPGQSAIEKAPGYICLAHELVHAFRYLYGLAVPGDKDHEFYDPWGNRFKQRVYVEELRVIGLLGKELVSENSIRYDLGLNSRDAYASPTLPLDQQGVKPVSAAPSWWPDCPTP